LNAAKLPSRPDSVTVRTLGMGGSQLLHVLAAAELDELEDEDEDEEPADEKLEEELDRLDELEEEDSLSEELDDELENELEDELLDEELLEDELEEELLDELVGPGSPSYPPQSQLRSPAPSWSFSASLASVGSL